MNLKNEIDAMKKEQLEKYGEIQYSCIIASLRVYGFKKEDILKHI